MSRIHLPFGRRSSTPRLLVFIFVVILLHTLCERGLAQVAPQAGRNVNMVSGTSLPDGDPFRQRQDEPAVAISTRNLQHLLAGANDYRTVDLPGVADAAVHRDSWLGLFKSFDGGNTWKSTLIPGYPQDTSPIGMASPLKGFQAGSDPAVRAGAGGLFYYLGIVFNRSDDKQGLLFVSRLVDNNNKEAGDPIVYVDTNLVHKGNKNHFLDKPWLAVDIPRQKKDTCSIRVPNGDGTFSTQTFPGGNVYVSYADIDDDDPNSTRLMFARSTNCGVSWDSPVRLSDPHTVNQGSVIAIDPNTGNVYVAWRQIFVQGAAKSAPHAIMIARSVNGGIGFSKPVTVSPIVPFDLATLPSPADCTGDSCYRRFRTDTYPTLAVDANSDTNRPGRVYVGWSELGRGPNGDARIVLSVSQDGATSFSPSNIVDNASGQQGHQIMPSLLFAAGKLMLVYYDFRGDMRPFPQEFLADPVDPNARRWHSVDVRAALADPANNPVFTSSQISRYLYVLDNAHKPLQAQANPVNYPMFNQGRVPFIGDYIDVTAPLMLQDKSGQWKFNTQPTNSPVFQSVWTDNRDVIPPAKPQDWTKYIPAGSFGGTQSVFDPSKTIQACVPGVAGMRNQNVYSARITQGLVVSSPGNAKPLGKIQRAFVVYVENATNKTRFYRLSLSEQPAGGSASFLQFAQRNSLDVTVAPRSSVARNVFMTSTNPRASAKVDVAEITSVGGAPVIGGLQSAVILNPDILNPDILNPDILNPDILNPDILNLEVSNPAISNAALTDFNNDGQPDIVNPDILNPDILNPDILNPDILNPDILNPDILNPDILNPDILNPDILNPDILNPDILNTDPDVVNADKSKLQINDLFWNVSNKGNTTSVFTFKMSFPARPKGFKFQLLLYRTSSTPAVAGCVPVEQTHEQLVANILNPDILNPDILNPDILNADVRNSSLYVAPGDSVKVQLRVFDLDKFDPNVIEIKPAKSTTGARAMKAFAAASLDLGVFQDVEIGGQPLTASVVSQSVDTADAQAGITQPKAATTRLTITTTVLPSGRVGEAFSFQLTASGGTDPLVWSLAPGSTLPANLTLSPAGLLSGSPTTAGTFAFTIQVTDADSQSDTRDLTFAVAPPLGTPAVLFVTQPNPCSNTANPDPNCVQQNATINPPVSLRALNGQGAPIANLSITVALGVNTGGGALSGTTTALTNSNGIAAFTDLRVSQPGTYTVVASASGFPAVATSPFNVIPKITITTTSTPNAINGAAYDLTIAASSGVGARTFTIISGALPPGLSLDADLGRIFGTPTASGTFNFTVQVTDSGNPPQIDSHAFTIIVTATNPPDLTITNTVTPTLAIAGGTLSYAIGVTNQGLGSAANVNVTDTLPNGLTTLFCNTSVGTCQVSAGTVTASLGNLGGSASASLFITALAPVVATPTTLINSASVSTTTPEVSVTNNQSSVTSMVNGLAGPPGGLVQALAIDGSNPNTIYAGTENGGMLKSVDGGSSWISTRAGFGVTGNLGVVVRALVVNGSTVFAATNNGIYASSNGGNTWVLDGNGIGSTNAFSIAMDPTNSSVLYAGVGNAVFKSIDGGATWTATNLTSTSNVGWIAVDKNNPSTVYVGYQATGLYKSSDAGQSWTQTLTGQIVRMIVIDPSSVVYAATGAGVFKSTDLGSNWTAVNNGLTSTNTFAIAADPTAAGTIYAATTVGVFKTTNGAANWAAANAGLVNLQARALAIDPTSTNKVYLGTGYGVYKSTTSGASWTETNAGLSAMRMSTVISDPENPGVIYAGSDDLGGVFRSGDSGASWSRLSLSNIGPNVTGLIVNGGTLYAASTSGFSKSFSGGASWFFFNTGPTNTNLRSLAMDPDQNRILFAGTTNGGLFKTTDDGQTWSASNSGISPLFNIAALAFDPTNTSISNKPVLYAASQGAGVYKTIDGGAMWMLLNNGLTDTTVNALAVDPINTLTVYAGTNSGVFKSTDGGLNWNVVNNGLTSGGVNALAIDPANSSTIYAGTSLGVTAGVFKSTNGGATWVPSSTGLTRIDVRSFAFDPTNSSTVYVGTFGGGVFKSTDGGVTWLPSGNTLAPLPPQLTLNVTQTPNPATAPGTVVYNITIANVGGADASNIAFSLPLPGNVSFVSCSTPVGSCNANGSLVTASLGTLAAGTNWILRVTANVPAVGSQSFTSATATVTTSSAQMSTNSNQFLLGITVNPPTGPPSAQVLTVAANPSNANTILAGTGAGGIFRSTDAGANWTAVNGGITGLTIRKIVFDPSNPSTVYAATTAGVFKSTNGGISWNAMNSGLTLVNSFNLTIDPLNPNTLYVNTASGSGIFKTTNGGTSWTPINSNLSPTLLTNSIVVDPSNSSTIYVVTEDAGLFKSVNSGGTWSAINGAIPSNLTTLDLRDLAIDPTNSSILYVTTNGGGVFKSVDGGGTWATVNTGLAIANTTFSAILIDKNNPSIIYVGGNGVLYKTTSGGSNWTSITTGLLNPNVLASSSGNALAFDPSSNSQTIYVGTNAGVFKTVNAGSNWNAASLGINASAVVTLTVDPANPAVVYAGASSDTWYKTFDGGVTWSAANNGATNVGIGGLAIDPTNSSVVYMGRSGGGGPQKSTNGGQSWTAVNTGSLSGQLTGIVAIAIDPSSPSTVYAGGLTGSNLTAPFLSGVFKTTNGATTWTTANTGLTSTDVRTMVLDPSSPNTVYVGTFGGGVFKTTNGAATWTSAGSGLTNQNVLSLALNRVAPSTIYAGTNGGGVFKTTDAGANWFAMNSGLTGLTVQVIAVDPADASAVFAGTSGGLFKSTNGGISWSASNTGLPNVNIRSLAIDPATHTTIYAGLNNSGVYKSIDGGATWQPTGSALVPFPAVTITATGGNGQSTPVGTAFTTALQATVKNANNTPASGVAVTFTASTSGATATFGGQSSVSVVTNASGVATSPTLTANNQTGSYTVTATTQGLPAAFALTNTAASAASIIATDGNGQNITVNTALPIALKALVKDALNNPAAGVSVTFTSPSSGASGTFAGSGTSVVVNTNASGIATAPTFTTNATGGSFIVTASVATVESPAGFTVTNIVPVSSLALSIPNLGGSSAKTAGSTAVLSGYAKIAPDAGKTTPAAAGLVQSREAGIVVNEAGLPASKTTQNGRMFIELTNTGSVTSGLFIANPNPQAATISVSATTNGTVAFSSSYVIPANEQNVSFVNQLFPTMSDFQGSLSFTSDVPVAATGFRGFNNERDEFIFTFIPLFDTAVAPGTGTAVLADFSNGGGASTQVVLVNTTNSTIAGNVQFLGQNGSPTTLTANNVTASSFAYSIPSQSTFRLVTSGSGSLVSGSVRVIPDAGNSTPAAFDLIDFRINNVTTTEIGLVSTSGNAVRMYVENSGTQGAAGAVQSYIAVTNPSPTAANFTFELSDLSGNSLASPLLLAVPGNGQMARDLGQLFPGVPSGVKGVLRISSAAVFSATEFRGSINARNDFLFAALPVINEAAAASSTATFIPFLITGEGYTSQFVTWSAFTGQATSGQLLFFSQTGLPLSLDILP